MERKDKIKNIKALLMGEKTPDDLIEQKDYVWFKGLDEPYELGNPDVGETKTVFTEDEYEEYVNSKHPKHKHTVFMEMPSDPRDEPIIESHPENN